MSALNITAAVPGDRVAWAADIADAWTSARDSVVQVGRRLIEAKAALPHGAFKAMVQMDLPFSRMTAYRLMAVAEDGRINGVTHGLHLPASWRMLYELSRLDDGTFYRLLEAGEISPDMTRQDAVRLRRAANKAATAGAEFQPFEGGTVEGLRGLAETGERFGVILADPPWTFEVRSDRGKSRAPEYPTMSLAEITALPVADLAEKSAVLYLWSTVPHLRNSLDIMEAWGFEYKSEFVWVKDKAGTGYWNRNRHEPLLIGTRGGKVAPAPEDLVGSVVEAEVGRHSKKPEIFHEIIEAYHGPRRRIELFARRERPGWATWGNEVPEIEQPKAAAGEAFEPP